MKVPPKPKVLRVPANDPSLAHALTSAEMQHFRAADIAALTAARVLADRGHVAKSFHQLRAYFDASGAVLASEFTEVSGNRKQRRSTAMGPRGGMVVFVRSKTEIHLVLLELAGGRYRAEFYALCIENHVMARIAQRSTNSSDSRIAVRVLAPYILHLLHWMATHSDNYDALRDGDGITVLVRNEGGLLCRMNEYGEIIAKTWVGAATFHDKNLRDLGKHDAVVVVDIDKEKAAAAVEKATNALDAAIAAARSKMLVRES